MQAWKQTFEKTADVILLKQGSNFRYQTRFKCSPAKKSTAYAMNCTAFILCSLIILCVSSVILRGASKAWTLNSRLHVTGNKAV